jgi:NAD(P)-dependent dehydrogenase (short-subunit alcohol dehydrogenase family)
MEGRDNRRELSFNGRSAVVTGAARGIGRAVVYRLAGLGARTVIWDRDGEAAEQAARERRDRLSSQRRPRHLEWAQVDVSNARHVEESMAIAAADGLDALVNNDLVVIVEGPDDETMAAQALGIAGRGKVGNVHVLM